MSLKIYNVLTHEKEEFKPLEDGKVKMYACGITVSGEAHIGHAYQSVVFDMILRYLEYRGYDVNYVRNYTDIDDKIIANSAAVGEDPIAFAERFIKKTDTEIAAIGSKAPTTMARATKCVPDIINFIQKLIELGHAYPTESGDVYFKLSAFPQYGGLSRVQVEKNATGVRKSIEADKHDDLDFALWKSAKPGEVSWQSPWGAGRPGWHIECSAMSYKYLGDQIDIHGGGRDLIFPHHENEIAQTEAMTGKKFANFWVHCGLVKINGQKMSKSLGNGITIQDMLEKYDSDVIRFALLRNTYSSDLDVTDSLFPEAGEHIYKMYSTLAKIAGDYKNADIEKTDKLIEELVSEFNTAMDDNFNTPATFAVIFKYMGILSVESGKATTVYDLAKIAGKIKELMSIFNLLQKDPVEYITSIRNKVLANNNINEADIINLISQRSAAKSERDFAKADEIRGELLKKHIVLMDSPTGTTWDIDLV